MDKNLFRSKKATKPHTTVNEAGGRAYVRCDKEQLAQLAVTGCFGSTFYVDAQAQLEQTVTLAKAADAMFLAKLAVFSRQRGFLKDMPAVLTAILSTKDAALTRKVFPHTVDNAKMLRNFVQVIRSGQAGRKSLGSAPKALVAKFLTGLEGIRLLNATVGNEPSLSDIIKLSRPKPANEAQAAAFRWVMGKSDKLEALPAEIKALEAWRKDPTKLEVPNVDFRLLTASELSEEGWKAIARTAPWHATRMNLNTFARHGVFAGKGSKELIQLIIDRLRDPEQVRKSRCYPYQLLMAYKATAAGEGVPVAVKEALQDAMEIATQNVPALSGNVVICPDVSGSMSSPVTGRRTVSTNVRCIDVAALVASCVLRANKTSRVIPFEHSVVPVLLNPRDSVLTNAGKLAAVGGGGTNVAAPLDLLVKEKAKVDLIIFISDNESWFENSPTDTLRYRYTSGTSASAAWAELKRKNPGAKLVCIDITPSTSTQVENERGNVLNIGGWSDQVFDLIAQFALGEGRSMVDLVEATEI